MASMVASRMGFSKTWGFTTEAEGGLAFHALLSSLRLEPCTLCRLVSARDRMWEVDLPPEECDTLLKVLRPVD